MTNTNELISNKDIEYLKKKIEMLKERNCDTTRTEKQLKLLMEQGAAYEKVRISLPHVKI